VIRNAVIHIVNEQPLQADLFEIPAARDMGLLCTNIRTMTGTRPVFIDRIDSVFFFPYRNIRFVEIMPGSDGSAVAEAPAITAETAPAPEPDEDLEIDEDFLRRIRDA
jgi:hypothetical protein